MHYISNIIATNLFELHPGESVQHISKGCNV